MCSSYTRLGKHHRSSNQRRINNLEIFYANFEERFSQDDQSGRGSLELRVFQAIRQQYREADEFFWGRSIGMENTSRKIQDR